MSIKSKIQNLIDAGNETTGESKTNLTDVVQDLVDGYGQGGVLQTKSVSYTPSTSLQSETVTPDIGYDGLSQVDVSVSAMPTGTEGTPTASKGIVSDHSVAVTPSVVNTAGYIDGGTKTGTAVTVSASELVSGTKSISSNGSNIDVTTYEKVDVSVPNTYSAGDEGKVVSSGALVAQTAHADVTPTTSDQTIDTTTNNSIKVKGDADLIAGNIKKDVEIFGVTGSYEGGGGESYDYFDATKPAGSLESNVTSIWNYAAYGRTGITSVSMPNLQRISNSAFAGCTALQTVSFPSARADDYCQAGFQNCTSLKGVVLPANGGGFYNNMFNGCSNLEYVDSQVSSIQQSDVFKNCTKLSMLVIRRTSGAAGLGSVNHFNGTPFANGGTGGTLYVPSSLVSAYQSASNWSTLLGYTNNQIKSIESTHTDPNAPIDLTLYYADGTPIS